MTFDERKLGALKRAYQEAVQKKRDSFEFEGEQLLTAYAKYLVEFLEEKMEGGN